MAISCDGMNWPQVVMDNTDGSGIDAKNIQDPSAILSLKGPYLFSLTTL